MANTNSDASDTAKAADAKAVKAPDLASLDITVDRSRHFAEIHGEHPLGFKQDHLPFDKGGRLDLDHLDLPEFAAGKAALLKRIERLKQEEAEAIKNPVADTSNRQPIAEVIENDPDAHINLVDWAKGKIRLQPHKVYAVAQRRLGKRYSTLPEVAAEMVKRKWLVDTDVRI